MNELAALDRTLRLVRFDLFPDSRDEAVLEALLSTRVRLRATADNILSGVGQTAFITTFMLLSELGISISLDIPEDVPLDVQPPLVGTRLGKSIADSQHLRLLSDEGPPHIEVVFGDTKPTGECRALRVQAGDWFCCVTAGSATGQPLIGEGPFGAGLAGVAAAAEVFRCTMREFGRSSGQDALPEHYLGDALDVSLRLPTLDITNVALGNVDVVSAGALTTAALYLLLRIPQLSAHLRIFDDDVAALHNLNRYLLLTRKTVGQRKVDVLASFQREGVVVEPISTRLTERNIELFSPLAERVVVGVDDIPSRWVVQRHARDWVGVAATSHFETVVSEHVRDSACCGCLHPYDDEGPDVPIPTISFVSAFAGFLLAYRVVRSASGQQQADATLAYPFNLGADRAVQQIPCAAHPRCPVGCDASRRLLKTRSGH